MDFHAKKKCVYYVEHNQSISEHIVVACELRKCIGKCVFTTSFTAGDAAAGLFGDGVAVDDVQNGY